MQKRIPGRQRCRQQSWTRLSRTLVASGAMIQLGGPRMSLSVPNQVNTGLSKVLNSTGLILAGALVATMLIVWAAFLLWVADEAVITLIHWL